MPLDVPTSRERFLILDITPRETNGLFINVDRDRVITFEKFQRGIDLQKFLKQPARKLLQASWEGNYLFGQHRRRIIAAADSTLATTIPIPFILERNPGTYETRITVMELEEGISQAMVKILPQCRVEAAKRFNVEEIDVVLVGAKAKRFIIDGRLTEHPAGFLGKTISLILELTFVQRAIFEEFNSFFSSPEPFFLAESAQARLSAASHVRPLPLNLIVADGNDFAATYILESQKGGYPVLYREKIQWPFENIFHDIKDAYSVEHSMAKKMYRRYRKDGVSPSVARQFHDIAKPHEEAFLKTALKAKLKGVVYVDADHELPFDLPMRSGKAVFENLPLSDTLAKFGFSADIDSFSEGEHVLWRYVAPFIEMYFERSATPLNERIRRRVHWLTH